MKKKTKIIIEIDNITEAQSIALQDLFATWVSLGNMGSSRWTSFFADGDGNFRPEIKVNGEKAKYAAKDIITDEKRKELWKGNEYKIDFDFIAWKIE